MNLTQIKRFDDFGLYDAYCFNADVITSIKEKDKLLKLKSHVKKIWKSLDKDKPGFLQLIWNIFTLRVLKAYWLRLSLPKVIRKINSLIQQIDHENNCREKVGWIKAVLQYMSKRSFLIEIEKEYEKYLKKALARLELNQDVVGVTFVLETYHDFVKELEASQRRQLAEQLEQKPIAQKLKLIQKINELVQNELFQEKQYEELRGYFQEALSDLQAGKNIPLPRWYYGCSTFEKMENILISEQISGRQCSVLSDQQKIDKILPPSLSSIDESDSKDFSLALDHHNTWKPKLLHYFSVGTTGMKAHNTRWISDGSDFIKACEDNIAFVITTSEKQAETLEKVKLLGKNIRVMSRGLSACICWIIKFVESSERACQIDPRSLINEWHKDWPLHY